MSTTSAPSVLDTLSAPDAVRISLFAQALRGPRLTGGPADLVPHLRGVQLDTISVLARSHELVAYARLGAVARTSIESAYWGPASATFEYWSHAACIVPVDLWPAFRAKRQTRRDRGFRWHEMANREKSCADVLARLASEGPLTTRALGGANNGGTWWDWSEVKIATEWLLDIGEVVCRERRGFERVYELAERAIAPAYFDRHLDDETCALTLIESAGRAMGVATVGDLAAYHGMHQNVVRSHLAKTSLRPVTVEGWKTTAYLARGAERGLASGLRGRTAPLSPFDSLLWDRARLTRLFGLTYRLEAYVPAAKRVVGYFAMPILAKEQIVGLVDPKRVGTTLHARHVVVHRPSAVREVAQALRTAATWVRCDEVVIDCVTPDGSATALRNALKEVSK